MDQVRTMDRMYRIQRHFYDLTRKYYLLGRDRMIRQMELRPGDRVLEVACGTARNLIALSRHNSTLELYGLDASNEMLKTAKAKISAAALKNRIQLSQCLAGDLRHDETFGLKRPFDAVFFSYGLSMIPPWREALDVALENVKEGGSLYIVDFWDQRELPGWFRWILKRWLALFGVRHRPELIDYLHLMERQKKGALHLESMGYRYAFIARFKKAAAPIGLIETGGGAPRATTRCEIALTGSGLQAVPSRDRNSG